MKHPIIPAILIGLGSVSVYAAPYAEPAVDPLIVNQFLQLDVNGNGVISQDEMLEQADLVRTMHLYDRDGFGRADFDHNGVIDKDELYAYEEVIPAE